MRKTRLIQFFCSLQENGSGLRLMKKLATSIGLQMNHLMLKMKTALSFHLSVSMQQDGMIMIVIIQIQTFQFMPCVSGLTNESNTKIVYYFVIVNCSLFEK